MTFWPPLFHYSCSQPHFLGWRAWKIAHESWYSFGEAVTNGNLVKLIPPPCIHKISLGCHPIKTINNTGQKFRIFNISAAIDPLKKSSVRNLTMALWHGLVSPVLNIGGLEVMQGCQHCGGNALGHTKALIKVHVGNEWRWTGGEEKATHTDRRCLESLLTPWRMGKEGSVHSTPLLEGQVTLEEHLDSRARPSGYIV